MANCSKHQRDYWFPKLVKLQHGEYCKGCGGTENLEVDKINNDDNHNITENVPEDFQILCHACNHFKNPRREKANQSLMTPSEITNYRAEKPMMKELESRLKNCEKIEYDQWKADSALKFDCSVKTIDQGYYPKYFTATRGPFEIYMDNFHTSFIRLKVDYDPI